MKFFRQWQRRTFTGLVTVSLAAGLLWGGMPLAAAQMATNHDQLNDQTVMALVWVQKSAEYKALCYQAYNLAWQQAVQAKKQWRAGDKPLAMVFDCDDTIVALNQYNSVFVDKDIDPYKSMDNLHRWFNEHNQEEALPGAVQLLQKLQGAGLEIFYVTDRDAVVDKDASVRHFKAMGFPFVDKQHVLLKTKGEHGKQARFDAITKKYNVVAYLGDNENDFPFGSYGKAMEQREQLVDKNQQDFGHKYILVPNPMYGSWEFALARDYAKMTPAQKDRARKALLYKWNGVK